MTDANMGNLVGEPISVRVREAVTLTGLSRSRIYELMASGDIQFAKVGSSTLILMRSLRQFVEDCRKTGDAPDSGNE